MSSPVTKSTYRIMPEQLPSPSAFSASQLPVPVRIITHNIRFATTTPSPHELVWPKRLPLLVKHYLYLTARSPEAILCLQEPLAHQLTSLTSALKKHSSPHWTSIGVSRDGPDAPTGEFNPILFRSDVWTCDRHETRWLSDAPEVPGPGFGATLPRVYTRGWFRHRGSGRKVVVVCTHLDHLDEGIREKEAAVLKGVVGERGEGWGKVVLAGDFNSHPTGTAYKSLTAEDSGMRDAREVAPEMRRFGYEHTFTGFEPEDGAEMLDYVFVAEGMEVRGYTVEANEWGKGKESDHRAVVVDLEI